MSELQSWRVDRDTLSSSPDQGRELGAMAHTLAACGHLAGAATATLVIVEPSLPPTIVVRGAGSATLTIESTMMHEAIEREAALMFPTVGPTWIMDNDQAKGTALAKVATDGAVAHILALTFIAASPVARARVARLMPHLRALVAAQIEAEAQLAAVEQRHSVFVEALDHSTCGIIAVRDDHSVLFANAAAAALLAAGGGLHIRRGAIRPVDYRQAARFEAALDTIQEASAARKAGKPPALVMLLPAEGHKRPLIVAIVPVRADSAARGASALIYLFQPDVHSVHGLDTIADLHGLSGVERRLLAQLCAGLTVAESADRLRIKLETARAYLKQIFVKTGTHRQTELVALMTRYLRAMRGDFDFRPG